MRRVIGLGTFPAARTGPATDAQRQCLHEAFRTEVRIARLSAEEGGPVTGFGADIRIVCSVCDLPFRFLGLEAGSSFTEPRVSVDATELRVPIEPEIIPELLGQAAVRGIA